MIATAARDHGHPDGPAGSIWGQWTPHGSDMVSRRYRLAELPERGPRIEHSATIAEQPFTEAAFDLLAPEILHRVHTAPPEPVGPPNSMPYYTDEEDLTDDLTLYDDSDDDDVYRAPAAAPVWPDTRRPQRTRWVA